MSSPGIKMIIIENDSRYINLTQMAMQTLTVWPDYTTGFDCIGRF